MTESSRPSWSKYFLNLAIQAATRSTCDRRHVGAILVRDRNILSCGYNGSLPGSPHCDDAGHVMVDSHCVRTVHAECNAILQAAKHGVATDGATLYCTDKPCWDCYKVIVAAGVKKIIFLRDYPSKYPDERIESVQFFDEGIENG